MLLYVWILGAAMPQQIKPMKSLLLDTNVSMIETVDITKCVSLVQCFLMWIYFFGILVGHLVYFLHLHQLLIEVWMQDLLCNSVYIFTYICIYLDYGMYSVLWCFHVN